MERTLELRRRKVEFRTKPDGREGRVLADVLIYNKPDDYRTTFGPGSFRASLAAQLPVMAWNHDWSEPIGRWIDADDNGQRMRLLGELDLDMIHTRSGRETDNPAVPRAHQIWSQMNTRTVQQFSIGFMRLKDEPHPEFRGVTNITEGWLDEVSPVIVGSVPGTNLIGTRSRNMVRTPHVSERRSAFPSLRK
jgi:HK97 family phage prohead protease